MSLNAIYGRDDGCPDEPEDDAPVSTPKPVQHELVYKDADGEEWDGVAVRVGKVMGRCVYQVSIPANIFTGAPERVSPVFARGLDGARRILADMYEGVA